MIHDELIVECPDQDADAVQKIVRESMQNLPLDLAVPLIAVVKIADCWADAK